MIDRIKDLAQGAIVKYPASEQWVFTDEELYTFARSIVKECIGELEVSKKCDPYTGELLDCPQNTVIEEQIQMLKEHFEIDN